MNHAEGHEAEEPQERPVFLICSVGGSPQPIATALRLLRPDVVWFLVSDGKNSESSRMQVESREIDYDRKNEKIGPGLKFADGCPAHTRIIEIPADNPDGAYARCRSALKEARRLYPDHRLVADYTGGTKSMTGALLMAAFAQQGFEVQFMAGVRSDLVKVEPGSERPQIMATDFIMAERDFAAAEQAIKAYDYAAAELMLGELQRGMTTSIVQPPAAWRSRLDQVLKWIKLMAQWDAFNHKDAQGIEDRNPQIKKMLETSGHLRPLLALAATPKGEPGWDICADLWLNAQRRGARGRYDDAVARLYRLVEATAQAYAWSKYRIQTGRIPPSKLPEDMLKPHLLRRDHKTGEEYAELALNLTVELLLRYDRNDEFAVVYGATESRVQGPKWLKKRNNSILAHGFVSIDHKVWKEARDWVEVNLTPFFAKAAFPQLPNSIPELPVATGASKGAA